MSCSATHAAQSSAGADTGGPFFVKVKFLHLRHLSILLWGEQKVIPVWRSVIEDHCVSFRPGQRQTHFEGIRLIEPNAPWYKLLF